MGELGFGASAAVDDVDHLLDEHRRGLVSTRERAPDQRRRRAHTPREDDGIVRVERVADEAEQRFESRDDLGRVEIELRLAERRVEQFETERNEPVRILRVVVLDLVRVARHLDVEIGGRLLSLAHLLHVLDKVGVLRDERVAQVESRDRVELGVRRQAERERLEHLLDVSHRLGRIRLVHRLSQRREQRRDAVRRDDLGEDLERIERFERPHFAELCLCAELWRVAVLARRAKDVVLQDRDGLLQCVVKVDLVGLLSEADEDRMHREGEDVKLRAASERLPQLLDRTRERALAVRDDNVGEREADEIAHMLVPRSQQL